MLIKQVKIEKLVPAEYNPRKLTAEQFQDIKDSLERFGFVDPIIVNKDQTIIGGHQRVKVWQEMGNDTVPVFYVDLTKEQEKELNVRLNKNTGEWDFDILKENFDFEDLKDWGFAEDELKVNESFIDDLEENAMNNLTKDGTHFGITFTFEKRFEDAFEMKGKDYYFMLLQEELLKVLNELDNPSTPA